MKSPLRYPGGKTRAVKVLKSIIDKEYPNRNILLSPFLGGGSFEIFMQQIGYTVYANDLFYPLYCFWNACQNQKDDLLQEIKKHMPMTKERFHEYRVKIVDLTDPIEIATYYYLINRTSFSGSTFCGGFSQQACDGRLGDSSLKTIQQLNLNIALSNVDCLQFLTDHLETEKTIVYADPPYYIESYLYGRDGDLHEHFNHIAFATMIKIRKDFVISYNDCPFIRELYKDCRILEVSWSYGMNKSKKSSEIIILPSM